MPPTAHGQAGQTAEQANLSPLSFLFLSSFYLFLAPSPFLLSVRSVLLLSRSTLPADSLLLSCSFLSPPRSNSIKSRVSVFLSSYLYLRSCDPLSSSAYTHLEISRYIYIYWTFIFFFYLLCFNCIKLGPFFLPLRDSHYAVSLFFSSISVYLV